MNRQFIRHALLCVFLIFGIFPTYLIFTHRVKLFQSVRKIHHHIVRRQKVVSKVTSGRLLCWILTGPMNHWSKAQHVNATWGKRCDTLLFMSSKEESGLKVIALENVQEGRAWLWPKTVAAFKYIFEHHSEADWILKADDDTYVIVENLRDFLQSYNYNEPHFFGAKYKFFSPLPNSPPFYFTGGAGYVLSRATLVKLMLEAIVDKNKCHSSGRLEINRGEDIELSNCLLNVGVKLEDTRDSKGRLRFFQYSPIVLLYPWSNLDFFRKHSGWEFKKGLEGVADTAISFHYVQPNMMYFMEWMLYHAQKVNRLNATIN